MSTAVERWRPRRAATAVALVAGVVLLGLVFGFAPSLLANAPPASPPLVEGQQESVRVTEEPEPTPAADRTLQVRATAAVGSIDFRIVLGGHPATVVLVATTATGEQVVRSVAVRRRVTTVGIGSLPGGAVRWRAAVVEDAAVVRGVTRVRAEPSPTPPGGSGTTDNSVDQSPPADDQPAATPAPDDGGSQAPDGPVGINDDQKTGPLPG